MLTLALKCGTCIFDALVPLRCVLCGGHDAQLCARCRHRLVSAPLIRRAAARGRLEVFALGPHRGLLRAAVLGLKYRNRRLAGRQLGALLGDRLVRSVDAIVPVPLHASRLRSRGFNQAEEIAAGIASSLQVPVACDALQRVRVTSTQSSLPLGERGPNVNDAFSAGAGMAKLTGLRVLIVDDVVTTGATIAACADALRHCGVWRLTAAAIALRSGPSF